MKIKDTSLINVVETEGYISHHVSFMEMMKRMDSEKTSFYDDRIELFKEKRFRKLILSERTKNNLVNYSVPKGIRYDVLRSIPNRRDSILIDKNNLLRYIKTDDKITGMLDYYEPDGGVYNKCFHIDLIDNKITISSSQSNNRESLRQEFGNFIDNFFNKFMVVVTYLELTPVTLNVIEGGKSFKVSSVEKIKNETKKSIIIVNTNWNTETISLQDISVRGHWRLQPYGIGRSMFKYIYINPFKKGITKRLSQKELVN